MKTIILKLLSEVIMRVGKRIFRKIILKIACKMMTRICRKIKKTFPDTWYNISYDMDTNTIKIDAKNPDPVVREFLESKIPPGYLGCNIYLNLTH